MKLKLAHMEFLTQSHLTGQSSNKGLRKLHFLSMPIFFQGFFLFQFIVIFIFLNLSSNKAWCETTPEKTPGTRVGFIGGPYLPSKIPGVTEILQVAGVPICQPPPLEVVASGFLKAST